MFKLDGKVALAGQGATVIVNDFFAERAEAEWINGPLLPVNGGQVIALNGGSCTA